MTMARRVLDVVVHSNGAAPSRVVQCQREAKFLEAGVANCRTAGTEIPFVSIDGMMPRVMNCYPFHITPYGV